MAASKKSSNQSALQSSSKRRKKGSNGEEKMMDRISDLPDSILCWILSFLPTKDAVATSILSKRWKLVWTGVPSFDLDEDDMNKERMGAMGFVGVVNKVLHLNNVQSIDKFCLYWINEVDLSCVSKWITEWVCIAIAKKVRLLDLDVPLVGGFFELPRSLFNCETLEYLELIGQMVIDLPPAIYLPRLVSLKLALVEFGSIASCNNLISGCPVLEFLSVETHRCDDLAVSTVSSPTLKQLELKVFDQILSSFEHYPKLEMKINTPALEYLYLVHGGRRDITIQRLPSLVLANIQVEYRKENNFCNSVTKSIQASDSVKYLTLSCTTIQALSSATVHFSANFKNLTKLVILSNCCGWIYLQNLLESSVNLEVLEVAEDECFPRCWAKWRSPGRVPRCLSSSLKEISIWGLNGLKDELAMIKYVLKHGRILRRLQIQCKEALRDMDAKFQLLQEISTFPRRSRSCTIWFS